MENRGVIISSNWYDSDGAVSHWFHGVFEGGGAKGIAYAGALLALQEKRCWFRAVAGASAGAITAALIASGLTPEEIAQATQGALDQLQTSLWKGLGNLRSRSGFFESTNLRDWLEKLLK